MGHQTRRGLAALAIILGSAYPAQAFYWRGWPSSVRVAERTLLTPTDDGDTPTPVFPPPDIVTLPPVPVGPPVQTPEPTTGVIALLGLGTVALVRKWKKG